MENNELNFDLGAFDAGTSHTGSVASGRNNEDKSARIARMAAEWSHDKNMRLFPVGKLLARPINGKQDSLRLADVVAKGGEIKMSAVIIGGKAYPLQDGFAISLKTCPQSWGCLVCGSAHGSGIKPSKRVDADGLADNVFYYRPSDRAMFSISATCWKDYVVNAKVEREKRFAAPSRQEIDKYSLKQAKAS